MNAKLVSNVVRCLSSVVFLVTCITSALTEAASYQKTDGTIVDPIRNTHGSSHIYSGNNLEPNANLFWANLTDADLTGADLRSAYLFNANLYDANLTNASLVGAGLLADLTNANLTNANLTRADLGGAVLSGANLRYANLAVADLTHANLTGADLYKARLRWARDSRRLARKASAASRIPAIRFCSASGGRGIRYASIHLALRFS